MIPRQISEVVEQARLLQDTELARAAEMMMVRVFAQRASGSGDVDHSFTLSNRCRLVYLRCHFTGGSGSANMTVSVACGSGAAYDVLLTTIKSVGSGKDVFWRLPTYDKGLPSPWSIGEGDAFRIQWTNPDAGAMVWGLEVGLALA